MQYQEWCNTRFLHFYMFHLDIQENVLLGVLDIVYCVSRYKMKIFAALVVKFVQRAADELQNLRCVLKKSGFISSSYNIQKYRKPFLIFQS